MKNLQNLKHIEKLIMGVDKDDTDTLDEIDARVIGYKRGSPFLKRMERRKNLVYLENGTVIEPSRYTRSIDAQAAIMPDRWLIKGITQWNDSCTCHMSQGLDKMQIYSTIVQTEPLARLLAIVRIWIWRIENDDS